MIMDAGGIFLASMQFLEWELSHQERNLRLMLCTADCLDGAYRGRDGVIWKLAPEHPEPRGQQQEMNLSKDGRELVFGSSSITQGTE